MSCIVEGFLRKDHSNLCDEFVVFTVAALCFSRGMY